MAISISRGAEDLAVQSKLERVLQSKSSLSFHTINIMITLEPETLISILLHLTLQEIVHISRVCRRFHSIIQTPILWRSVFLSITWSSPSILSTLEYIDSKSNSRLRDVSIELLGEVIPRREIIKRLTPSASTLLSLEILQDAETFDRHEIFGVASQICTRLRKLSTIKIRCKSGEIAQTNSWLEQFRTISSETISSTSFELQELSCEANEITGGGSSAENWLIKCPLKSLNLIGPKHFSRRTQSIWKLIKAKKQTLEHLGLLSSRSHALLFADEKEELVISGIETLRLWDEHISDNPLFITESNIKLPNLKAMMGGSSSLNSRLMRSEFPHLRFLYITTLEQSTFLISFFKRTPSIQHLRFDLGSKAILEDRNQVLDALTGVNKFLLLPKLSELDLAKDVVWFKIDGNFDLDTRFLEMVLARMEGEGEAEKKCSKIKYLKIRVGLKNKVNSNSKVRILGNSLKELIEAVEIVKDVTGSSVGIAAKDSGHVDFVPTI